MTRHRSPSAYADLEQLASQVLRAGLADEAPAPAVREALLRSAQLYTLRPAGRRWEARLMLWRDRPHQERAADLSAYLLEADLFRLWVVI
ncbi:MAG TPA: hypothetical protein VJG32_15145 [Anaerolineae bacterium]|nr:hypothetical protein [Anaerolineae bacterium]